MVVSGEWENTVHMIWNEGNAIAENGRCMYPGAIHGATVMGCFDSGRCSEESASTLCEEMIRSAVNSHPPCLPFETAQCERPRLCLDR
jgi:hypothetical protein